MTQQDSNSIAARNSDQLPVVFLLGPTASGKTDVGIALAQSIPCQLISVDSSLVYRGMDIGTAKPSAQERQLAPHNINRYLPTLGDLFPPRSFAMTPNARSIVP